MHAQRTRRRPPAPPPLEWIVVSDGELVNVHSRALEAMTEAMEVKLGNLAEVVLILLEEGKRPGFTITAESPS